MELLRGNDHTNTHPEPRMEGLSHFHVPESRFCPGTSTPSPYFQGQSWTPPPLSSSQAIPHTPVNRANQPRLSTSSTPKQQTSLSKKSTTSSPTAQGAPPSAHPPHHAKARPTRQNARRAQRPSYRQSMWKRNNDRPHPATDQRDSLNLSTTQ